ncbi:DEAD/DEAH box helicase [Amycolatopsis minnesotensis]|uniref:DEAD/DEAH box helicase n=1 Tax=Amycolatopsis minnesotensis TaxID=337894 RepID=A0ABP5D0J8_9PSEU
MLVLHAFWVVDGGLCLWAEDSGYPVTSRSRATRSARPHPFAVPAGELAGLVSGKADEVTLLLPSSRTSPLDSPELIRITPRPPARSEPALSPWIVPVVTLDAAAALAALTERTVMRHSASWGYFAELAAFARGLAGRGRVLPALEHDDLGAVAQWRPVLRGRDVLAAQEFAAAMPPVCRAASSAEPHELVGAVLHALADAAVREGPVPDLVPSRRGRRPARPPAAEAWLAALSAPDGRFDADDLGPLAEALRPWDEIGAERTGPARATFRLTEVPAEEETPPGWRLEFLLQSAEDPSLVVPAERAWADEGALGRWLARPQELLLAELGRASRVYPQLAPGLRRARPCALDLDADGAYHFLSVAAPRLDEAGFGVLLPTWWNRRRELALTASAHTPVDGVVRKAGKFGEKQLVEFRWQLAVGDDEALTDEEIASLADTKAPLIRLRGQWVTVDPEQLRRGLEFLKRKPEPKMTAAEVLALAASHPEDLDIPLPVAGVHADGWLGDLLDGTAEKSLSPVPAPAGFTATLRPYQERGLSWLAFLSSLGLGACLADDMGLGKTVQLLALEAAHRAEEPDAGPTLLICPMSLVGNWQREAAKFAPDLRVYAHHGGSRPHGTELADRLDATDLVVTTYATATRDIDELAEREWRRVVLDEAQAIKNSASRSSKAVRRLRARHRVALTGTPMENRLAELWSVMDFANPGMLGSPELFRTRYAIPVERHGRTEPVERLRKIIKPYLLRRLKTDPAIIDDLPEKIEVKQYCRLTTEQASLYQSVVDDMMDKIENSEGIERRGNVLAAMTKLKQVCNHPAQLLHDRSSIGTRSGKVIRLEEILDEIIAEGGKVLCFTQFTEFAELLLPHLSARFGTDIAYLHGGTTKKRRDDLVTAFSADDGPPIFLLSLKAGGTGLNLTAANHVIHLDRWWNPAVENQATDRAFRIGQQRTVGVHKFVCTGTLEEKIDDLIEEKKALADLVVSDGESWLTELSTTDLRAVFALTEGAVDD